MFYWFLKYVKEMKKHCGHKNWRLVMPVKFWHMSLRFWFFLSYLIDTVTDFYNKKKSRVHISSHPSANFILFSFKLYCILGVYICPEMVLNRHWMEKFMFMSNNSLLIPKSTRYNFLSIGSEWMKNWVLIERQQTL